MATNFLMNLSKLCGLPLTEFLVYKQHTELKFKQYN